MNRHHVPTLNYWGRPTPNYWGRELFFDNVFLTCLCSFSEGVSASEKTNDRTFVAPRLRKYIAATARKGGNALPMPLP